MRHVMELIGRVMVAVVVLVPSAHRAEAQATAPATVDLLMVYTPGALAEVGGLAAMQAFVDVSVRDTNAALARSDARVVIRLVDLREIPYYEPIEPNNPYFQHLTTPGDGQLDEVFTWRDAAGADLVGLVSRSVPGGGQANVPAPSGSPNQCFFAVNPGVRFGFNRNVFPHEVGHTLGAGHHWLSLQLGGTFAYSKGHFSAGQFYNYADVMVSAGPPPAHVRPPINWSPMKFSSPLVFLDGVPTGVAEGQPEPADNARTIRQMGPIVAAYRPAVIAPQAAAAPTLVLDQFQVLLDGPGRGATFSVHVTGSPFPVLQWQRSIDQGASWADVTDGGGVIGATTAVLSIGDVPESMHRHLFRATASNTQGTSVSGPAELLVGAVFAAGQQADFDYAGWPTGGWQEFVPRVDYIQSIDVFLSISGAPGPVTARLETEAGAVIASAVIERSWPFLEWGEWVTIPVGKFVDAAAVHRIRLVNAGSTGAANEFRWRGSLNNPYAEGRGDTFDGVDYAFRVFGFNSTEPPTIPTGLRVASMVGNRVGFEWRIDPNGVPAQDFVLEGGATPGQVLASIPTGSANPRFSLNVPTGSFFVRIRARRGTQVSAPSNEIPIHVGVPVAPSPPAGLVGLANGTALTLAWRNTFGGGAATSLVLDVTGTLSASIPLGLSETFSFPSVPPGTYTLSLRAVNSGGSSASSHPVTLIFPTPCSGVPAAPSSFLAFRADRTLFVQWQPSDSGAAPTSYLLDVSGALALALPTTGRQLSGTVPPGTYNLRVAAVNPCGGSPFTATQTVVVP